MGRFRARLGAGLSHGGCCRPGVVSGPEPSSVPSSSLPGLLESSLALCSVHHGHSLNLTPFRCPVPARACPCLPRPSSTTPPHPTRLPQASSTDQIFPLVCQPNKGFTGGSISREPTSQCRRCWRRGFSPWLRKISWRRPWQPTPVFLPGEAHGQGSLAGYIPWGRKESNRTAKSLM